jgi:hypothetical protein
VLTLRSSHSKAVSRLHGEGERAGDLIIRMMRVAKRRWTRTGPGHTLNGHLSISHQGVEQALQLMMSGSFGTSCSASSIRSLASFQSPVIMPFQSLRGFECNGAC